MQEAFARLRGYARDHSCRLNQVAHNVIEGKLSASALGTPADQRS
jgi:AmiR/NasT family two-component response regulator